MLWIGVHLPALSLESFIATLAPEPTGAEEGVDLAGAPQADDELDIDPLGPVALVSQHRLVAANAAARAGGLRVGQQRATALALLPQVRLGEADPQRDAAALEAVVHAVMAFTPAVSVAPNHVVLAEVHGSLRYFGGLPRLVERLRAALAPLGHALRLACAPTPQAAEWLAAWRDDTQARANAASPWSRACTVSAGVANGAAPCEAQADDRTNSRARADSRIQSRIPDTDTDTDTDTGGQAGIEADIRGDTRADTRTPLAGDTRAETETEPRVRPGTAADLARETAARWRACIGALPVSLMAAAVPHLATFRTLGLATVADLWKQPRAGLTRRFGGALLADIDRALGDLADPRESLQPAPVFDSRLELFMRADDSAALLVGAAVLLNRLSAWAAARHGLVAGFELRLHHESRRKMRDDSSARTTALEIGLGEPVTDTAHLHALLRERLQRLPLAASVIELSLHCHRITAGAPPNAELFPSAASVGEGWHRLLERFEARLGPHNIQRLQPVADHRPERATAVVHGKGAGAGRGAGRPRAAAGTPLILGASCDQEGEPVGEPAHWPRLRRPTWLLSAPQPLRDQAGTPLLGGKPLWLVAGPERIETGWWDGDFAGRDYFIAQADDGALLWVYRCRLVPQDMESGWYLHGRFG